MEIEHKISNLEVNSIPTKASIQKEPIMEGELTGYPSIDKPWLMHYSKDIIESELPEKTIYRYILDKNKKYMYRTALNYFGNKITYDQMFKNIDKVANALIGMGIKKGDIITISMPTTPETIYLFYAISKIGAIANMVDPRKSVEEIAEYVNMVNSNHLFLISNISEKAEKLSDKIDAKNIVLIDATESLPPYINYPLKFKNELKNLFKGKKLSNLYKNWNQFLGFGKNINYSVECQYEKDLPIVIVYTGGTTGTSKGVILTNDNINAASFQCENCGFDFQRQHKWLNIMPPFIAYGVGNGLHLPLACGMEVYLIPKFDPKKFDKLLDKYHPNHMTGVPTHYDGIVNSKVLKNKKLNFIFSAIVGGDKLDISSEEKINEYFDSHDCNYKIAKGYGLSEVSAAVCATSKNDINEIGSVGIPFSHTTISIFDFETKQELKYGEIGEVCITGPNTMLKYFNNEEETNNILIKHDDGKVWVHSGDIGYMNEIGNLFILGRKKEMIIRHDGFKIYPILIENCILKHKLVQSCKVIGIRDEGYSQGELPKAYIVLNKVLNNVDETQILLEIKALCNKYLAEYLIPVEFEFKDSLPKTSIGKIDFLALKKENQKIKIKEK